MLNRFLKSIGLSAATAVAMCAAPSPALAEEVSTTECTRYQQPEFIFSTGEHAIAGDVRWLKDTLESMVAEGSRFKPGETLQIGPMVLKLEAAEGGKLRLTEPDMKAMPIKFINSVATTLLMVRRQRDTVWSVDAKGVPVFVPIVQPILVGAKALQSPLLYMMKVPYGKDGALTWLLIDGTAKQAPSPGDMRLMSVYEVLITRSDMLDFLALPDDYEVTLQSRHEFAVTKKGEPVKLVKGSYLDLLRQVK